MLDGKWLLQRELAGCYGKLATWWPTRGIGVGTCGEPERGDRWESGEESEVSGGTFPTLSDSRLIILMKGLEFESHLRWKTLNLLNGPIWIC